MEESDFYKEDFLIKKSPSSKPPVAKVNPPAEKKQPGTKQQQPVAKSAPPVAKKTTPQAIPQKNTAGSTSKNVQPKKPADTKITDTIAKTKPIKPPVVSEPKDNEVVKKNVPVPGVIKERENPLIKKIQTASPDILLQLYDNGEIDGDTITVYDNNEVIAFRKGLTGKPITLNIKADLNNAHHEFIMVANNLGTIPPTVKHINEHNKSLDFTINGKSFSADFPACHRIQTSFAAGQASIQFGYEAQKSLPIQRNSFSPCRQHQNYCSRPD